MELGAVVVLPQTLSVERDSPAASVRHSSTQPMPLWPVVGRNIVQEWINRIRQVGVEVLSVAPTADSQGVKPAMRLAREGVDQFLVVSLQSYAEIDLLDFVRYHRERRNPATIAFNEDGPLGVEILSRTSLTWRQANTSRLLPSAGSGTSEYWFRGYAKHLRTAKGYCDLVADALSRHCELTPRGSQFGPDTWVAENAKIASSVRFTGPSFVGADTILRDGVTVGPFASVEHGCVIDCGTIVEESTILPQTFLAAGLNIRRSVVDGTQLEQLDSGIVADLSSAGLARRLPRRAGGGYSNRVGGHRSHVWEAQPASGVRKAETRLVARTAGGDIFAWAV